VKLFEKRTLQILVVASAVAVAGLLSPKAAHAVAAALVQVTNTVSNPAITQEPGHQANQILHLINVSGPGSNAEFFAVFGGGIFTFAYFNNGGSSSVVITAADIQANTGAGCPANTSQQVNLYNTYESATGLIKSWSISGNNTYHFAYPNGIVLPPGSVPSIQTPNTNACTLVVDLFGYYTAN
jgi:hypothetical protein